MPNTSFTTLGCPKWSLGEIFKNAQTLGYQGVELRTTGDGNHFHPEAPEAARAELKALAADHGVKLLSIMGYTTFAHLDPAQITANQTLMRHLIKLASAVGAPYIRTFCGRVPANTDHATMIRTVATALTPLAREAADQGVTICMETHDDWCAGKVLKQILDQANSPGLGVVYDIFNAWSTGIEPWEETYRQLRPHIGYCHLKDAYRTAEGKWSYMPLGAGQLPVGEILKRLKADAYAGYFSFEWEKKWHPEIEEPERVFPQFPIKLKQLWDQA
jgi:sugar phosphate isomerase/epimerase